MSLDIYANIQPVNSAVDVQRENCLKWRQSIYGQFLIGLNMTNVSATVQKLATRKGLFAFAVSTLEAKGWRVARVPRGGKASLREISKDGEKFRVSIRTSQDAWIAFPRKSDNGGWITLDDVDYVVAVSVDDRHDPTFARVHMIPAVEARARFDRAYRAREQAGHTLPNGRGIWLSLYDEEASDPVSHVGAGMGLDFEPMATRDLRIDALPQGEDDNTDEDEEAVGEASGAVASDAPLTIPEAKRRLAASLGVPESAIRISVEH